MGIRTALRLRAEAATLAAAAAPVLGTPARMPLSPWATPGHLEKILLDDLYPMVAPNQPPTRTEALKVPAIAKARAILHSLIDSRPLVAMRAGEVLAEQPPWLYRSDTGVAPQMRIGEVLDDLIFNEASLLVVQRGAPSPGAAFAPIQDAVHCPRDRWGVNGDGYIEIDGEVAPADQVVIIYGPGPGLLAQAGSTIRASRDMEEAWAQRVRTPVPPIVLEQLEDNGMEQEEAQAYVDAVSAARRKSGVMYVPFGMKATMTQPGDDSGLFIEGRNALRLDIANFFNLPAALLDGSVSTASLTYSTQEGRRNELFDYSLAYWTAPIENALSLDNVCPRGQRIRFDFGDLQAQIASPTGPVTED